MQLLYNCGRCIAHLKRCDQTSYKKKPKLLDQFQQCEAEAIPYCVIIGPDELAKGVVKVSLEEDSSPVLA